MPDNDAPTFDQLLRAFADAHFACGCWTRDSTASPDDYPPLAAEARRAEAALRAHLAETAAATH